MTVSGLIVDVIGKRMFTGHVNVEDGMIVHIEADDTVAPLQTIIPGFIDAHVHIESSLLVPSEFARMAVVHGTVATVSDPHEIANVCGMDGIRFMLDNAAHVPFTFAFGAPSCVPATSFETAGAEVTADDVDALLRDHRILYLSEMMNWPGVLFNDELVHEKLAIAKMHDKPIDGHAPGLKGEQARQYAAHGITTDHECFTLEEAQDKLACGMNILIREGSAARNFNALHPLIASHPSKVMFCCDDAHPDMLKQGHINVHVRKAIALGYSVFDVLCAACVNPVLHYKLPVGLLREGDKADFVVVDNLTSFDVLQTWINGSLVAANGKTLIDSVPVADVNKFSRVNISEGDLAVEASGLVRVIVAHDGQLVTTEEHLPINAPDVLKMCVVNRYSNAPVAVGFVKGFQIQNGALASSVAHDSHNVVAVGTSNDSIVKAVNLVIKHQGGLAVVSHEDETILPLPVGGLMSSGDAWEVAEQYTDIDAKAKALGSTLRAPFMTLSFMALLVIPQLKLSDKGLFDGEKFSFVPLVL